MKKSLDCFVKRIGLFWAAIFIFTSCQHQPTVTTSQSEPQSKDKWAVQLITPETVILDTRNPFEFSSNRIPGSINIQWSDFTFQSPETRGVLMTDSYALARRLALWGIDPKTPVLVVGNGPRGRGEEGRVAWMLLHLGVNKIQTARFDLFRARVAEPGEEKPPANKPYWMPGDQTAREVTWADFQRALQEKKKIRFLDVRTPENYKKELLWSTAAKFEHRPWYEFFTPEGRVNTQMLSLLDSAGWKMDEEIIVISEDGVSSGAVTYALDQLGFNRAKNFSGGYELINFHRQNNKPKKSK